MSSDTPPLRLLVPTPADLEAADLPPDAAETRLAALYASPATRHLRVNMVASVDGGAWGDDGRSGSINDAADWRVFRVLRALADVVLVGAGTARAEAYTALTRPRGLEHLNERPLELALVTRTGQVPTRLLDGPRVPWVVTGAAGAPAARSAVGADRVFEAPRHPGPADTVADDGVDLAAGLDALAAHGLARVLCEGGPHLLGSLLAADLVDELCVTTTPQLVGPGPDRIVPAAVGHAAATAVRTAGLGHLLAAPSGTLLARWTLR